MKASAKAAVCASPLPLLSSPDRLEAGQRAGAAALGSGHG